MLAVDQISRKPLVGSSLPRIAPPVPAKSLIADYRAAAKELGIKLMAWQQTAARYVTATNGKRWAFPDVAIVVARQNGKTTMLLPYILMHLRAGRTILHTAQNRSLPRETFLELAAKLDGKPGVGKIRYANGQEVIPFTTGGSYTLVAPTRSGARGHGVDVVILDEVREQHSFDLLASIKPALTASANRQIIYISNAGDEDSVVLNDLRRRGETDSALAYLEWSAAPDRAIDDRDGWAEANPALGTTIQLDTLEDFYRSLPAPVFETEHLCRWVLTMQPRLVSDPAWHKCHLAVEPPRRTFMGISCDAAGRASAAIAWQQSDGTVGLRVIADVTGSPLDIERFGEDLRQLAKTVGVSTVAFDDWTDKELAKYFKTAKPMTGKDYANASANFVRLVDSGKVHWDDADSITEDLMWTARKRTGPGEWMAVKAKPDRPVTAVLAAIRAVGLASGPLPAVARVM